ncbi:MAG: hypothetical protein M3O70_28930 [Actinomycetota bacterium]|nr:hypothetical protein [Actinomycetota bacterium]
MAPAEAARSSPAGQLQAAHAGVPATLSARVRLLSGGSGRKSDSHDARSTAIAALHGRGREVGAEDAPHPDDADRRRRHRPDPGCGDHRTRWEHHAFPSRAHFASDAGTAAIEASSGDVSRQRLCNVIFRHLVDDAAAERCAAPAAA